MVYYAIVVIRLLDKVRGYDMNDIYKAIANTFRQNYCVSTEPVKFVLRDMIDRICQQLIELDPCFDRVLFIKACGI